MTLTDDGHHIVDHVAADAKSQGGKIIQITGPSTQVAPGYDPSLAEPRIEAVEAALVADGIGRDRLARASETTDGMNVTHDPSGKCVCAAGGNASGGSLDGSGQLTRLETVKSKSHINH